MGKHRLIRRPRRGVLATLAAATAIATVAVSPAAGAATLLPLSKQVTVTNADLRAKCQITVQSVDPTTSVAHMNGYAQIGPKTFSGYLTNVFSKVVCDLYDATNTTLLDSWTRQGNKAVVTGSAIQLVEPYSPTYHLCVTGYVKLRNGDDSGPVRNCN
jgi:hypothetical protein